jgi:hypothetical protein
MGLRYFLKENIGALAAGTLVAAATFGVIEHINMTTNYLEIPIELGGEVIRPIGLAIELGEEAIRPIGRIFQLNISALAGAGAFCVYNFGKNIAKRIRINRRIQEDEILPDASYKNADLTDLLI